MTHQPKQNPYFGAVRGIEEKLSFTLVKNSFKFFVAYIKIISWQKFLRQQQILLQ